MKINKNETRKNNREVNKGRENETETNEWKRKKITNKMERRWGGRQKKVETGGTAEVCRCFPWTQVRGCLTRHHDLTVVNMNITVV